MAGRYDAKTGSVVNPGKSNIVTLKVARSLPPSFGPLVPSLPCLLVSLSACLVVCLLVCLLACLLACLFACVFAIFCVFVCLCPALLLFLN